MEKTKRNSKFEILRILCMLLIIMHHFACHGGYIFDGSVSAFNKAVVDMFIVGGKIGVNVFVLISGYFLVKSDFKFSKLFKLLLEVCFYSTFIYLIFVIFGKISFSFNDFIKIILPTITKQYWFVTCYIILYILSPFLNKMLKNFEKKDYFWLIALLLVIQCVLPKVTPGFLSNQGWFITLYIIASYFRNCKSKIFDSFTISLVTFLVSFTLIICANVFFGYNLWGMNQIACLICSVSMFCTFKNIKKSFSSKFINIVSATTFGIYLLHDNNYIRHFLWREVLDCPSMIKSNYFVLFAVGSVLAVFVVCSLIDLFRIYVLERPLFLVSSKIKLYITQMNKFSFNDNYMQSEDLRIKANSNTESPYKVIFVDAVDDKVCTGIQSVKKRHKCKRLLKQMFEELLEYEKQTNTTILVRDNFIKLRNLNNIDNNYKNPMINSNLMCFYVYNNNISLENFVLLLKTCACKIKIDFSLNYGEVNFETTDSNNANCLYYYGDAVSFINKERPYNAKLDFDITHRDN